MTELLQARKPKTAAKQPKIKNKLPKIKQRIPLQANLQYNRAEAALATGVSYITIVRAQESGELTYFRIGRRALNSGAQLIEWLETKKKEAK